MDNQVILGIRRKVMSSLMILPLPVLLLCAYAGTPAHAGRQRAPVSVMDNGRYLIGEDGKPFIVIGACTAIADQAIIEAVVKEFLEKGYGKNGWEAIPEMGLGFGLFNIKDIPRDIKAGRCRIVTIDSVDTHFKKLSAAGVNVWRTWEAAHGVAKAVQYSLSKNPERQGTCSLSSLVPWGYLLSIGFSCL